MSCDNELNSFVALRAGSSFDKKLKNLTLSFVASNITITRQAKEIDRWIRKFLVDYFVSSQPTVFPAAVSPFANITTQPSTATKLAHAKEMMDFSFNFNSFRTSAPNQEVSTAC